MKFKLSSLFFYSSGLLIVLTALAKLVSTYGTGHILQMADPILGIPFRKVFWIVGSIEMAVASIVLFGKSPLLRAGLVAVLATNFIIYRLGLILVNYQKPCPCLGSLTDALHIRPETADTTMKIILAYLLLGSYTALFSIWKKGAARYTAPSETPVSAV
jgi:hypothetical protein